MKLIDIPSHKRPLLNLGCGRHFHPDWINLDLVSYDPEVIACDLTQGVPLPSNSMEAVYHSHVLEHLTPSEAGQFLSECQRVLKPGGVLRIAVPDLEQIARVYLSQLEQASAGQADADLRHEWMTLELVDQMVRHHSGGLMGQFMVDCPAAMRDFLAERMGGEVAQASTPNPASQTVSSRRRRIWSRLNRQVGRVRDGWFRTLVRICYGRTTVQAWDETRFRRSGEIHRWMYDRQSLGRLLASLGFSDIQVCRSQESRIENFAEFRLDHSGDRVRKPDSLFLEARRPAAAIAQRVAA